MGATTSSNRRIHFHNLRKRQISIRKQATLAISPGPESQNVRHCIGGSSSEEFPLADKPSILLHVISSCNLFPQDLAKLEATCSFFRKPAQIAPDHDLSITELAALDMCNKRAIFKPMTTEQKEAMKLKCGGSWKLVLKFLLVGEVCYRREKSQAIAGPGHSIVVTSKGDVYSFGANSYGQLGHGKTAEGKRKDEPTPRLISSMQGIRIVQAAVGSGMTMLLSDAGKLYACGTSTETKVEHGGQGPHVSVVVDPPELVAYLKDVFVVQATAGYFFTAVLSREGRVYTFYWGNREKLGHQTDISNVKPYPLLGALENLPVVQIAAGYCYLLALVWHPYEMLVYSVGCGLGGKLGHGSTTQGKQPQVILAFQALSLEPVMIAAGTWHAAVIGKDGRVCTWGWGSHGCLGHGDEELQMTPKVVEALNGVKAVYVAAGNYTTFVIADNGDVYSFGYGGYSNLGHDNSEAADNQGTMKKLIPERATSLNQIKERIVQISPTNTAYGYAHTFALTESGKLYAFGKAQQGQLGIKLGENQAESSIPR